MEINETSFGPRRYLALRKEIPMSQVTDQETYKGFEKLSAYIRENDLAVDGRQAVLYFTWNMPAGRTDLALAIPVRGDFSAGDISDPELSLVEIPNTPASLSVHTGPYDGLRQVHDRMKEYLKERGWAMDPLALEEYVEGPMGEGYPSKWVTNVYYLHQEVR